MANLAASFAPASAAISYLAGLLTALSPCVLPLLPIVVGGALSRHRAAPVLMGVGMTVSFAVAGLIFGALGPALGVDAVQVHQLAAIALVAFGAALWLDKVAALVSRIVQPLALAADNLAGRVGHQSAAAALFFGGLLGLAWTPCAGPMLASTLALVATGRDGWLGALLLGLFGLGAATPLIAAAYASRAGFQRITEWERHHDTILRRGFGTLAMLSGLFLATGLDKMLATRVTSALPDAWLELVTRF